MNNIPNKENRTNYEILVEEARRRFSSMDMVEVLNRTGIVPQDGYFRIRLLGRGYAVSAEDGTWTVYGRSRKGGALFREAFDRAVRRSEKGEEP